MIWPFKRKEVEEEPVPPFRGLYYRKDEELWKFTPAPDITAYELAMITPTFYNGYLRCDYMAYFEQHNLMRHFVLVEDEI